MQGAEGNSYHSERNISGKCTIICDRQELWDPVMRLVLDDPNSDHTGVY